MTFRADPDSRTPSPVKIDADFVTSAAGARDFPRDGLAEVALVGRSNVGKSSLINALVRQRWRARARRPARRGWRTCIGCARGRLRRSTWWICRATDTRGAATRDRADASIRAGAARAWAGLAGQRRASGSAPCRAWSALCCWWMRGIPARSDAAPGMAAQRVGPRGDRRRRRSTSSRAANGSAR